MSQTNSDNQQKAEKFYQQYAKPLEKSHQGEYLAVSHDGTEKILGRTLLDVIQKATKTFGLENFIFKIGTQSIGTWR